MKRSLLYILVLLFTTVSARAQTQTPVNVNVTMVPPVSPYLNQALSTVNGRLMVQLLYTGQGSIQVKLAGRLERLSPWRSGSC